jgi:hypothetical protein
MTAAVWHSFPAAGCGIPSHDGDDGAAVPRGLLGLHSQGAGAAAFSHPATELAGWVAAWLPGWLGQMRLGNVLVLYQ